MKKNSIFILIFLLFASLVTGAQEVPEESNEAFLQATDSVQQKLEESIEELNRLRERVAAEKIPLSSELSTLESELEEVRAEYQQTTRTLDSRTLDLTNLRNEIESRKEEATFLSNLLGQYIRNFESRLHIAEIQLYQDSLEEARLAPENSNLSKQEVYQAQSELLTVSLDRLNDILGGFRFDGTAVNTEGIVKNGTFVMIGPAAIFRSEDSEDVGTVQQRLGSLEPTIIAFNAPEDTEAAAELVVRGEGYFPLDPTLGNAHKVESTEETLLEHVQKGGVVMYPIFALAAAALLVALVKWFGMILIRKPSQKRINSLLKSVSEYDKEAAEQKAKKMSKAEVSAANDFVSWFFGGVIFGVVVFVVIYFQRWFFPGALVGTRLSFIDEIPSGVGFWLRGTGFALVAGVASGAVGVVWGLVRFVLQFLFGYSPIGRMLQVGVEHIEEPRDLIEEVMYERVMETRLKLERFLPFIAISAASAPLLGLLGTVTGIIETFKLITVFGSGDVKTLSGGISEALITTEFGLIVAIPSLLLHAFLSRRVRSIINQMEQAAVSFANQVSKTHYKKTNVIREADNPTEITVNDVEDSRKPEEESTDDEKPGGNGCKKQDQPKQPMPTETDQPVTT